MTDNDIEVTEEMGCLLVRARDKADQEHRWWFDQTDAGRLVFISEVIHVTDLDDDSAGLDGRHYVDEEEAEVPPKVREKLVENGHDTIFDTDGFRL